MKLLRIAAITAAPGIALVCRDLVSCRVAVPGSAPNPPTMLIPSSRELRLGNQVAASLATVSRVADSNQRASDHISAPGGEGACHTIVEDWMLRAPFEAWDWMLAAPERETFVLPALRALAKQNAADALAFALLWKSIDSVETTYALSVVAAVPLSSGEYSRAAGLVELTPNHDLRLHLITRIAPAWGRAEPADALRWAVGLPAEDERLRATFEVIAAWAARDPRAAATAAAQLPAGALQDEARFAALSPRAGRESGVHGRGVAFTPP